MTSDVTALTSGWEMDTRPVDVVVISSQVAYGAVGNTATSRVLTEAGYRCVQIPTVLLGTLPHYPTVHGGPIPDAWFSGILDDLVDLEAVLSATYVLVGYLASPQQAKTIAAWFEKLREASPDVQLIVDPAMGDDDVGLYTDPAVADAYAEFLVPLASGLTPNRFELEMLSGGEISDVELIRQRAENLRAEDGWVIVTSAFSDAHRVGNVVVQASGASELSNTRVESRAKGAGDIFAATVVARLLAGEPLGDAAFFAGEAVARALSSVSA